MEHPPASLTGRLRPLAVPAAVLLTGIVCAAAAAAYVARAVEAQQEARFGAEVSGSVDALRSRMEAYTAMLRATRGLFDGVGEEPDDGTFARFVESLQIGLHYPGIQGIGFSKLLYPSELAAHEARMRGGRWPEYRVWPSGQRELYSSIVQLEPLDWRNQRAIGYDMLADPTRREAMLRARDTGDVAASARVELVQEAGSERQAGFLMYLPIYGRLPGSPEDRARFLVGWVYAPFRATDLLSGTLQARDAHSVGFAVHDGTRLDGSALLHESGELEGAPIRERVERLEIAGRPWTLRFIATRGFASRTERALPGAVLAVGLAVAALLFLITRGDARARARAERAARRSAFLADAGKALSASTAYETTVAEVAALAAARIADACLVLLLEPQGPTWSAGHRDAEVARRLVQRLHGEGPATTGPLGVPAAIARAEPVHASPAALAQGGASASASAVLADLAANDVLTVPLLARGEPLGAIVLVAAGSRATFHRGDVPLAEDLARLVAAAVDTSRLYRRAQEAVAARDEFVSIASHELKTPLTSLVLHTDSLRNAARRGALDQVQAKADLIRRSVDRLTRLVSSLLDISRISAGRLDLEIEETDLAEVAQEVVERFADEARRAGCEVRLTSERARGRWDRTRLDQVLTNLLSNAIKYGPGQPIDVRVEPRGPATAVLSVSDRGIGISEADQRRIFQRFERAVSRRHYGGFGLGLWIVRQIVEAQGGSVRVESSPGGGSTFTVELATGLRSTPQPLDRARPPAPSPR